VTTLLNFKKERQMEIPENMLYTKEHEWVLVEGKTGKIGVSDYAQQTLGDITYVELPAKGTKIIQFGAFGTLESVKAVSDIYTPVSGTVTEINQEIVDSPELINQSPYEKGWLITVEIENEEELQKLLKPDEYKKYVEGELEK